MKNAIKVLCFVLFVIIAGVSSVYVYFTWDVGEFKTVDGSEFATVIITDYIAEETDVVIPNRLRGKKVISIDEGAFNGTDITSVKLSDNIVSVGTNAFQNCAKLTSIDLGNSVKSIGDNAFSNCPELISVKFSPSVEKIGNVIFGNDTKLATIDLNGNENFKFVDGVIYSADMTTVYESLATADLADYSCPETVVNINGYAFYSQDELKSITLNNGVKSINEGTFIDCKGLTELTLPDSVVNVGTAILSGSGIKTVKIPASVTKIDDNAFFNAEEQVTIVTTKGSYAAKYAERKGIPLKIVDVL